MTCDSCGSDIEPGKQMGSIIHKDRGGYYCCTTCEESRVRYWCRLPAWVEHETYKALFAVIDQLRKEHHA